MATRRAIGKRRRMDAFEKRFQILPEPKLQLIGGRFVVGNGGTGNLQLLRDILHGWGAEAAVPMTPAELWWRALAEGFRSFEPPHPSAPATVWLAWAKRLKYTPRIDSAGPMLNEKHRACRQRLHMGLFSLADDHRFAMVTGRDVIMRLGEDALTPDVFVVGSEHLRFLNKNYQDGPADLVMEVLWPGQEEQDRQIKMALCVRGKVPEFWIVDPHRKRIEFYRLVSGRYRECFADGEGKYRPAAFPGL